ncbi:uncharacterized protein MONBRDRAFT_31996 [Monosiga brevicollis MX1]|uniref:Dynein axonemal assembly factor 4 n=1 Tax=Monosiga brevicollis TaxID=81824 RepID=A9UWR2_MONBE|nr:uncharacterized protein MONBRDRAFT_31996 [Monosiga brevicollis MX1]EDQ90088.1 predicted protein [Monosiga brevicollis MX1]|eukprot:XP_001744855.1 hypothetical protein [Monosiga brevicollis MX1]
MPVVIKDFNWTQTDDEVHLEVPLKGVHPKKADVYTNDVFVKVNAPPFLFEVDLFAAIDDGASKAVIGNGVAVFTLVKREPATWPTLHLPAERAELLQRRAKAQARAEAQMTAAAETRALEQHEKERAAVRRQMEIPPQPSKATTCIHRETISEPTRYDPGCPDAQARAITQNDAAQRHGLSGATASANRPPVRTAGTIKFTFSKREFTTPQRESYRQQEEEWLEKQAAARKAVEAAKASKPGDVEHDPLWYRDKGRQFFQNEDYQSAINAYTAGLTLDPSNASLYSLRAAAHLKCTDPQAGAIDAGKALSLLQPPCPSNAKDRLRAHLRRAVALEMIEDLDAALHDYRQAVAIAPHDADLQAECARVQQQLEALRLSQQSCSAMWLWVLELAVVGWNSLTVKRTATEDDKSASWHVLPPAQGRAVVILVDNGSLRAASFRSLMRSAHLLAQRLDPREVATVVPASLRFSDRIKPSALNGARGEVLTHAVQRALDAGYQTIVITPFFIAPSDQLRGTIPTMLQPLIRSREEPDTAPPRVVVARALVDPEDGQNDQRIARALCDNVLATLDEHDWRQRPCTVAVVDHGSPTPAVTHVRNLLGTWVRDQLHQHMAQAPAVVACSMERRPDPEYDFNEPLLESLPQRGLLPPGHALVVAYAFLSPGRHAGKGGDIDQIIKAMLMGPEAASLNSAPAVFKTNLLGQHPIVIDILRDRCLNILHRQDCLLEL